METKNKIRRKLKGRKLPREVVEKVRQAHIGLKYNVKRKKRNKREKIDQSIPIIQFDMNGVFIKKWNSIMDAAIELSLCRSGISRACRGIYKQCGGFLWKHELK